MKTNTLATLLLGFAAGAAAVLFCQTEEGAKVKEKVKSVIDDLKKETEDE